jgi:hypothetical protein
MQVVNFCITLPDEIHPAMRVHMFGPGIRDVTVEVPQKPHDVANQPEAGASSKDTALAAATRRAEDEYVLGGYAGI